MDLLIIQGSVKAINAARLAMMGDGDGTVHLDDVIHTMMETGNSMKEYARVAHCAVVS